MSRRAVSTGSDREVDAAGAGLSPRPQAFFPGAGSEEEPRFPLRFPAGALGGAEEAGSPHSTNNVKRSSWLHPLGGDTTPGIQGVEDAVDRPILDGSRSPGQT